MDFTSALNPSPLGGAGYLEWPGIGYFPFPRYVRSKKKYFRLSENRFTGGQSLVKNNRMLRVFLNGDFSLLPARAKEIFTVVFTVSSWK